MIYLIIVWSRGCVIFYIVIHMQCQSCADSAIYLFIRMVQLYSHVVKVLCFDPVILIVTLFPTICPFPIHLSKNLWKFIWYFRMKDLLSNEIFFSVWGKNSIIIQDFLRIDGEVRREALIERKIRFPTTLCRELNGFQYMRCGLVFLKFSTFHINF